jgi:heme/copper-type cytochrome/quinol oxidase subunit 2
MAGPLADALFWIAVVATAIAHAFILRSTIRGMRAAGAGRSFWEWTWAVLPAISLVILFLFTWRAMHPGSMNFLFPGNRIPIGGIST